MSVLGRLRSWFKGLDLLGASKDGEKGLPVAPAPTASVRNTEQRVPSNAVAAAPAATASAQGQGASNAQAPQARASATFPAASQQQQPQAVTQPASHNKQAAASGPAAPARAKLTPEQQREEFFAEYGEANRYSILEVVGKGSYGIVCSAVDNFTGEKVAIKKITNVFEHVSDATRILREIKLLRMLKHPDIVKIQHIMLPPNPRDYQDIYVVFELMETDLHQVIKANDDLTPEHHQFFLYQMLRGLKYLHSAKVFHRDLKPKNILANADCKLKICDFGLARPAFDNMPTMVFWTDYVATRWYRAPELCGSFFAKYSPAIDIWGVGCIFAEVLLGRPLFPGKNVVNQLELITDLLGTPSPDVVAKVRNEKARRFLQSMPPKIGVPFSQVFPGVDRKALSLLRAMLSFDPAERPTAEQALQHPYFAGLHNPAREPTTTPVSKLAFDFDRRKLTVEEVRELIYLEILEYHPSALAAYQSGNHPRANFSHPNALENFKRVFMHLESNPGTVLAPGYQGKARQVVAAPAALPAAGGAVATAAAHQPRQPSHGRDGRWAGTAVANGQGGAGGEQHRSSRPEGRAVAGPCGGQACNAASGVLSHPMSYDRTCGYGLAGATDAAAAAAMSSRAWPSAELRQRMGDCKGRTAVTGSLVSSGYPAPGGVARGQAAGQHAQGGGTTRQVVSGHGGPMVNAARSAAVVAAQLSGAPEAVGGQRGASCAGCQPRSSNSSSGASSTATITTTATVTSGMVTAATNTTNGSSSNMVVQRGITSTQEHHTSQLQLSPSAARQANGHTGNGLAADGAHAAGCGLLSPMGRHSLQLHRTSEMDDMDHNIATRVSMPAPAAARAAAPVEPSQQTATASMVTAAQVAMQPDVDAWMLNRHSLPGPACPEGCAPGAAVATRASAHACSDVAAAVAVAAAAKERSGGAPVVPSLGLPGSIYGSRSTGISAFGLVGLPTDGVVLSDREREEVYRDSTEELDARLMRVPPQRLYRAASIS